MGLLDKLFGGDKEMEKAAKDILGGIFGEAAKQAQQEQKRSTASDGWGNEENTSSQNTWNASYDEPVANGPSGESWGPVMPNEPNQYNFNGTWRQYFENIFGTEFARYRYERDDAAGFKRPVYTFYDGAQTVLVVELMSSSSEAKKLRERCRAQGIPYLRFYYDYDGWWNNRSYVVKRMENAIRGL